MQYNSALPEGVHKIATVTLDDASITRRSREVEAERETAIRDLMAVGHIRLESGVAGPYSLLLSRRDQRLHFRFKGPEATETISLPLAPFRGVIKDYFLMCESYYAALAHEGAHRIQTLDMARRGTHNEGAERLAREMERKAAMDTATARALFTLVCVLHLR